LATVDRAMTQLASLALSSRDFIDFKHLPMWGGYGPEDIYRSSICPVLSIGLNPSCADKNQTVQGPHVTGVLDELFKAWGTDELKLLNVIASVKEQASKYFDTFSEVHNYFKTIEPVLNIIESSYFHGKRNRAIHRDVFPWSTVKRWALLPEQVQSDITKTFALGLFEEILRLQPRVVILGIEDDLAKILLPALKWQLLALFVKGNKIRVNKSWVECKQLHKKHVLFIQTTPTRFPFGFLTDTEKNQVGNLVKVELQEKNIVF